MKRFVKSSHNPGSDPTVDRYMKQAVRNIANYIYNNVDLGEDDPRADYFVENIINDSEVEKARAELLEKIYDAVDRQMRSV